MSEPETLSPSTLSAADSPVRTSATPDDARDSSRESPARDSGENSNESLASYDPDSCSWRTSQHSLFGGLTLFSQTWPRSGSMRNGIAFRRPTLVPLTAAIGSGLWATPVANRSIGCTISAAQREAERLGSRRWTLLTQVATMWRTPHANNWKNASTMEERIGGGHTLNLQDQVRAWPTPTASDAGGNAKSPAVRERGHGTNLAGAVRDWPTPTASSRTMQDLEQARFAGNDPRRPKYSQSWPTPTANLRNLNESPESFTARAEFWRMRAGYHNHIPLSVLVKMWLTPVSADSHTGRVAYARGNPTLEAAVQQSMWPTPSSRDWKDTPGMAETAEDGRNRLDQLARRVYHEERKHWPTPRAMDAEKVPSGHRETSDSLNASVARAENMQVSATGQLNPTWVEWLMGFPLGWTDCEDSETPSSRKRRSGSAGKSGGR